MIMCEATKGNNIPINLKINQKSDVGEYVYSSTTNQTTSRMEPVVPIQPGDTYIGGSEMTSRVLCEMGPRSTIWKQMEYPVFEFYHWCTRIKLLKHSSDRQSVIIDKKLKSKNYQKKKLISSLKNEKRNESLSVHSNVNLLQTNFSNNGANNFFQRLNDKLSRKKLLKNGPMRDKQKSGNKITNNWAVPPIFEIRKPTLLHDFSSSNLLPKINAFSSMLQANFYHDDHRPPLKVIINKTDKGKDKAKEPIDKHISLLNVNNDNSIDIPISSNHKIIDSNITENHYDQQIIEQQSSEIFISANSENLNVTNIADSEVIIDETPSVENYFARIKKIVYGSTVTLDSYNLDNLFEMNPMFTTYVTEPLVGVKTEVKPTLPSCDEFISNPFLFTSKKRKSKKRKSKFSLTNKLQDLYKTKDSLTRKIKNKRLLGKNISATTFHQGKPEMCVNKQMKTQIKNLCSKQRDTLSCQRPENRDVTIEKQEISSESVEIDGFCPKKPEPPCDPCNKYRPCSSSCNQKIEICTDPCKKYRSCTLDDCKQQGLQNQDILLCKKPEKKQPCQIDKCKPSEKKDPCKKQSEVQECKPPQNEKSCKVQTENDPCEKPTMKKSCIPPKNKDRQRGNQTEKINRNESNKDLSKCKPQCNFLQEKNKPERKVDKCIRSERTVNKCLPTEKKVSDCRKLERKDPCKTEKVISECKPPVKNSNICSQPVKETSCKVEPKIDKCQKPVKKVDKCQKIDKKIVDNCKPKPIDPCKKKSLPSFMENIKTRIKSRSKPDISCINETKKIEEKICYPPKKRLYTKECNHKNEKKNQSNKGKPNCRSYVTLAQQSKSQDEMSS